MVLHACDFASRFCVVGHSKSRQAGVTRSAFINMWMRYFGAPHRCTKLDRAGAFDNKI